LEGWDPVGGVTVGAWEGSVVEPDVGFDVGDIVVGFIEGSAVGFSVGLCVGFSVGLLLVVGPWVGFSLFVGTIDGLFDGSNVGFWVGLNDGFDVGDIDGEDDRIVGL